MLDSILNLDKSKEPTKLKRRAHKSNLNVPKKEVELEYVYDVYYRDKAVQETWEVSRIGYIKFQEDENDLVNEEDNDSLLAVSDDEDSNAEDFYQNDYPEDEDAGNDNDGLEVEVKEDETEILEEYDEIYEKHFNSDEPIDFLKSLQEDEDSDIDIEEEEEEENYKRQNFFPNEEDDELAKHRDKIFGKLERMINEYD